MIRVYLLLVFSLGKIVVGVCFRVNFVVIGFGWFGSMFFVSV